MLKNWFVLFLSCLTIQAFGQDSVVNRVIFIGDAGEMNFKQETIIPHAAALIIKGRSTVMYLGDNIYPKGMGLSGSKEELETAAILRSQYEPMRKAGAPVYFIPGNHDWDRSGKDGLAKIRAQGQFLALQKDSLLRLIPSNGCPDPVEIPMSEHMVMIAYDSEWWLFPYKKNDGSMGCDCNSEAEILERLRKIRDKNKNKTILVTSHHPFYSYGVHAGYYSWKDHIFPLTILNKNYYLPLPVIGSLYPLLRSTAFSNPEDMNHAAYKHLKQSVKEVFNGFPNYLYISGHDHGLQFIKADGQYQIVSGSGSKSSSIKGNNHLLYKNSMQGFVTVDMMLDRSTQITYYTYENKGIKKDFTYNIPFKNSNY